MYILYSISNLFEIAVSLGNFSGNYNRKATKQRLSTHREMGVHTEPRKPGVVVRAANTLKKW